MIPDHRQATVTHGESSNNRLCPCHGGGSSSAVGIAVRLLEVRELCLEPEHPLRRFCDKETKAVPACAVPEMTHDAAPSTHILSSYTFLKPLTQENINKRLHSDTDPAPGDASYRNSVEQEITGNLTTAFGSGSGQALV